MKKMNAYVGVNSYHEITPEKFKKAEAYIQKQIGILNSAPSAPKKSDSWRAGRIKAVQARCNQLNIQAWRKDYMRNKFGRDSMIELPDEELEQLYRAVMSKRK